MSVMKANAQSSSRTIEAVEVLVIGGGVIGGSIAYHVARQGRRVLVVERQEVAVEPAASWASAGGVRPQGLDPAEAPLARFDPAQVAAFLTEPATANVLE